MHANMTLNTASEAKSEQLDNKTKDGSSPSAFEADHPFILTVVLIGGKTKLDLPVTIHATIQDIRQYLLESPEFNFCTCFSLQARGKTLNEAVTLEETPEFTVGEELHVVEEPYSERDVKQHLMRFREVLSNYTNVAPPYGIDGGISYLTAVSGENVTASIQTGSIKHSNKKQNDKINRKSKNSIKENGPSIPAKSSHLTSDGNAKHAFYGYDFKRKPFSLLTMAPERPRVTTAACLKSIDSSQWNPPPHYRRTMGDLTYLSIITLENEKLHITCSASGFFVNSSTDTVFNPAPASPKSHHAHTLPGMLAKASPLFNAHFNILQEINGKRHTFEYFPAASSIVSYPWCLKRQPHQADPGRTLDAYIAAADTLELWSVRDYNDDLQTSRELPHTNVQERIIRDATLIKIHSEFVDAAIKGAISIRKKGLQSINPHEPDPHHIFIHENIFFSAGIDTDGKLVDVGGWEAAQVTISKDVDGIRALNYRDIEDCYTLGTAIIDYAGRRILAQTIIPGLLRKSQEQQDTVSYGSIDSGTKEVATDPKFHELAKKVAEELHLAQHTFEDKKRNKHTLWTSVDTKGILGTDGRMYLLDLFRLTPVDVEWLEKVEKEKEENKYPHKMVFLRHELVEAFLEFKFREFLMAHRSQTEAESASEPAKRNGAEGDDQDSKTVKDKTSQARDEKQIEKLNEFSKKVNGHVEAQNGETAGKEQISKGMHIVSSNEWLEKVNGHVDGSNGAIAGKEQSTKEQYIVKSNGNPKNDERSNGVKAVNVESEGGAVNKTDGARLSKDALRFDLRLNPDAFTSVKCCGSQKALNEANDIVRQASKCITEQMIPSYILELVNTPSTHPVDGETLTKQMHVRGINMRYLGHIAEFFEKKLPNYAIKYTLELVKQEMVARACKKVLRGYLKDTPSYLWSHCVSHFLNCLFSDEVVSVQVTFEDLHTSLVPSPDEKLYFGILTPASLHTQIQKGVLSRFRYNLKPNWYKLRRLRLLRAICIKVGIQIEARDYSLSSTTTQPDFKPTDIMNLYPIIKSPEPRSSVAEEVLEHARMAVAKGERELGLELMSECVTIAEQVYGPIHPETGKCLAQLAMLHFSSKDFEVARDIQKKAVIVMERTLGIDDPETMQQYMKLGYFEYSINNIHVGLKYMRHALNCWEMLVSGDKHPESAQADANIATALQKLKDFKLSTMFFERACCINEDLLGRTSVTTAISYQSLTKSYFLLGEYRKALASEREAFNFYKERFGLNDVRSHESAALLRTITERAVIDAKREKGEMEKAKNRQLKKQRSIIVNEETQKTELTPAATALSKGHLPLEELLKFISGDDITTETTISNSGGKNKKINHNNSNVRNGCGPYHEIEH